MKKSFSILFFLATLFSLQAQDRIITGTITDEKMEGMVGVIITTKDGSTGTQSDFDGSYSIKVKDSKSILVFNFTGYKNKEIVVGKDSIINVILEEDKETLQELVSIGYSTKVRLFKGRSKKAKGSSQYEEQPSSYHSNSEEYSKVNENIFANAKVKPISTFSIDVDVASYTNIRRFLNMGQKPPKDAVRVEEMINYFTYDYPQPVDEHPFSINTEFSSCPWNSKHNLLQIGLQGKKIPTENLPPSNLVFLIDVSGSMEPENRLPLLKKAFKLLVKQLRPKDQVSIVVYSGAAGLVLPPTSGDKKEKINAAIDNLNAGGSTAGGDGIQLAYEIAMKNFLKNGNNRVILATDGDFNVGVSNDDELVKLIEEKRESGVFLTCLGFGMGNYKDSKLEKLANKGNGNYAYIDNLTEANKVFVNEFGGTLFTIAKDVKIQIEFNPANVQGYRLIGYENRILETEDFEDDKKDAGELGSGHTVTALYEIVPVGVESDFLKSEKASKLKYKKTEASPENVLTDELLTVKFRYKEPKGSKSNEIIKVVKNDAIPLDQTSENYRFASAVAAFGMLLYDSPFKSNASYKQVIQLAKESKGKDPEGYRGEMIRLVKTLE